MRTLKAAELILDYDLYPRNNIDGGNLKNLCDAIAAGVELPPVVIDRKTRRVVDGFHRTKAYLRTGGPDAAVSVIEKGYRNDQELFQDAVRYNASHGAKLDPCDRARCALIAQRLHIDNETLARALNMPLTGVEKLVETRTAFDKKGNPLPLKRTVSKGFAGKKLTPRQEEANTRLSGMNQSFYANQLIELIESNMLDTSDEALMGRLTHLKMLLDKIV